MLFRSFLDSMRPTPIRMAAVHRYLLPHASQESFNTFVRSHLTGAKLTEKLTDERLIRLYDSYGPGSYDLPDQGFIAKVHPLDLWMMGYLLNHPDATFKDIVKASQFERQEVVKTYLAVVRGHPPEAGEIDHALTRLKDDVDLLGQTVIQTAQDALTRYHRLATAEIPVQVDRYPTSRYALVELEPVTGRRHQLRR